MPCGKKMYSKSTKATPKTAMKVSKKTVTKKK